MSRPRSASRPRGVVVALTGLLVATLVPGCSSNSSTATTMTATTTTATTTTATTTTATLTVFAAASLKSTFTRIGTIFQTENPGSTVTFNFAGSSDLVTQLTAGAPADVFASADTENMTRATAATLVTGTPVNFASNILTIVTPPGNPAGVKSFADLAKPGPSVVVCAPQVPCGAAAATIETKTGITLAPVSEENSVTDVLGKVTSGQADAGLVYVTDAKNAGAKVTEVAFPEAAAVVNVYPIATLSAATQPALATKFVDLVTGPEGQQVLATAGFNTAGFRPAPSPAE